MTLLKRKVAEGKVEKKIKLLSGELFLKLLTSFQSDYKTSILYFRALLEMTPGDPYLSKRLGIELIKIGRLGEARGVLEELYQNHGITPI